MDDIQTLATQALVLITAFGALAAALTQGIKAIVKRMGKSMPEGMSAIIAGALSCGLTAVSLWDGGAQWQTALIATIIAYYAPQIIYNGAAVGHMVASHGGE
jgi:hypothetical protein